MGRVNLPCAGRAHGDAGHVGPGRSLQRWRPRPGGVSLGSSPVGYRVAADLVVLVHLAFVAFVVLGGVLAFRWPRARWVHLPAAFWGVWIEWTGGLCPLTPLEVALRRRGGEAGYTGGFVEHYVLPLLYPNALTRPVQVALGAGVVLVNVVVYWWWWRRRRVTRLR